MKDANGAVIGPLLGFDYGLPRLQNLATYVVGAGVLTKLNQGTGLAHECYVYFESFDCTGTPYMGADPLLGTGMDAACGAGDRLFRLSGTTQVEIVHRSTLRPGTACLLDNPTLANRWPAVEVLDGRYPYAAPLQIAFE